jgi:CRISPR-associated protein Csx10
MMPRLTLVLAQDAHVGDRPRRDFAPATLTHVPGTVVRGAFATAWITRHGRPDERHAKRDEFERLFLGGVIFGPAFSDGPPPPLSLFGHKHGTTARCGGRTWDLALQGPPPNRECPDCHERIEPVPATTRELPQRRRPHVEISTEGLAVDGKLFIRRSLMTGSSFQGHLTASVGDVGILEELGKGGLRIGGGRTAAGAVTVHIDRAHEPPPPRRAHGRSIVVRLASPGLFVDDFGRPCRDPNLHELEDALGVPVDVSRRWTRWAEVGGWDMASGLPKPVELAVAAGSTYVLTPREGEVTDARLREIARRGIGLRRHEGFGALATGDDTEGESG